MIDYILILVTCASRREARKIQDGLLKKKLVACANIIGSGESKFWWKGKLDNAKEVLVFLKTTKKKFKRVETEIRRLHSYDVPEIIALPIVAGNEEYLKWLSDSVR